MFGPLDPLDNPTMIPPNNPSLANINWAEHQRRQRTLRMLMMFLMILLLMDGDEQAMERQRRNRQSLLRKSDRERIRYGYFRRFVDEHGDLLNPISWDVWKSRREEDGLIVSTVRESGVRYGALVRKNSDRDLELLLRERAERKVVMETKVILGIDDEQEDPDTGVLAGRASSKKDTESLSDSKWLFAESTEYADDAILYHYPRNATGYYRGIWLRVPTNSSDPKGQEKKNLITPKDHEKPNSAQEIMPWVQQQLQQREEQVGLFILPLNSLLLNSDIMSGNATNGTELTTKHPQVNAALQDAALSSQPPALSLTNNAGRAAFQLYSRPIPAMTELSIVDGLIKLYDGTTTSFVSRRTDVLLRVRGIIIHSSGKLNLISSEGNKRSLLGIQRGTTVITDQESHDIGEKRPTVLQHNDIEKQQVAEETTKQSVNKNDSVQEEMERQKHRRLQDLLSAFISQSVKSHPKANDKTNRILRQIRDDVLDLYESHFVNEIVSMGAMEEDGWSVLQSVGDAYNEKIDNSQESEDERSYRALFQSNLPNDSNDSLDNLSDESDITLGKKVIRLDENDRALDENKLVSQLIPSQDHKSFADLSELRTDEEDNTYHNGPETSFDQEQPMRDDGITPLKEPQYVYPFPYVCDDANDSIKKSSSAASRRLPARELALEANAANCDFEINLDVQEQSWTFTEWQNAVLQRLRTVQAFNPYLKKFDLETERLKRSQILNVKSQIGISEDSSVKEALVMTMSGTIESTNCNFTSFVNVTAIRTNWEHTTAKAINYSFYMMLTCLLQIVVLLRQLLHTQAQSAASNVSLFCVGWQTVLDAILCIAHIFLCLVMQPLFTAFASVAFFKLLIFCVIEMKYMALIIQARSNANNPNHTQDDLRRQITLLHLRFYMALMVSIICFWYGQQHRTLFILLLYSFWVPQIIMNAIRESRKPMHPYYIYGMSVTRMIAPLYVFAAKNNFLKEVNPDFPSDPVMCRWLILWMMVQTAVLVGQGKYGTRFMIPQR